MITVPEFADGAVAELRHGPDGEVIAEVRIPGKPTEREAIRQRLRNYALAHALDHHITARCRWATENGAPESDHQCRGFPGSASCLCTCHDRTG